MHGIHDDTWPKSHAMAFVRTVIYELSLFSCIIEKFITFLFLVGFTSNFFWSVRLIFLLFIKPKFFWPGPSLLHWNHYHHHHHHHHQITIIIIIFIDIIINHHQNHDDHNDHRYHHFHNENKFSISIHPKSGKVGWIKWINISHNRQGPTVCISQ